MRLASNNGLCDFCSGDLMAYRLPSGSRTLPVVGNVPGNDCVVALRALAEDTRVRIVALLIDRPLDVGEIAHRVGASPYNVSKHLRILREAGLLKVEKNGRKHLYRLPDAVRRQAAETSVLDLGCCSFQFDGTAEDTPKPDAHGPRPVPSRSAAARSNGQPERDRRKRAARATPRLVR